MKLNLKKNLTYPKIVALGFSILIAAGTILLMLPAASRSPGSTGFMDALFTSASASCVTGLVTVDTYHHWTLFGQIVILCLIQIGGLGFLTILTAFSMVFNRKIGLKERSLLQESVNTMYIGGIVKLAKKIVLGTFIIELLGAILLSVRFVPEMGLGAGIYNGIFTSVSSFCNAGFELMGRYEKYPSLTMFRDDYLVNITVMMLVLIGGLGFFVWDDLTVSKFRFSKFKLHTKLVVISTLVLVFGGAAAFFVLEYNNELEGLSIMQKINASFFMSVTPRTVGFNTVDLEQMSSGGRLLTIIFMFIGGNSGSTAGGIKTTTIIVLLLSAWASLRNQPNINVLKRRLEPDALKRAASVVIINTTLTVVCGFIICVVQKNVGLADILFEVFSAINTVGFSTGIVEEFNMFSRLIIIFLMFCGRVGSLSFALLFTEQKSSSAFLNPMEKINIG